MLQTTSWTVTGIATNITTELISQASLK